MRNSIVIDQGRLERVVSGAAAIDLAAQLREQGFMIGGIATTEIILKGTLALLHDDGVETIELEEDWMEQ
jgi:hypothetical protein